MCVCFVVIVHVYRVMSLYDRLTQHGRVHDVLCWFGGEVM